MSALAGRTMIMSGGGRGIGLEIAKKAAADGAKHRAHRQDRHPASQAARHDSHGRRRARAGRRHGLTTDMFLDLLRPP
jgi:citronellol/citronellal dehydrogenase